MNTNKYIKRALISVFDKENLEPIVKKLNAIGVEILSTGGTQTFIENLGIKVVPVEDVTSFPSILGGRVKTLHPKVFGGILNRRDLEKDQEQVKEFDIPSIDLVIVDLYPFEDTVASGADHASIIEKVDIGGISLIRAAAKNYKDVIIVPSKDQYKTLIDLLEAKNGESDLSDRKKFAAAAFNVSSHYDTHIFNYFNEDQEIEVFKQSVSQAKTLRYGENPHQKGVFYGDLDEVFEKHHGKELSYNNLLDVEAAVQLMAEFNPAEGATFAVLKHNNACGVATRETLVEAYTDALAADSVSAFGGILISNQKVDVATATEVHKLFCEVLIAPGYDAEALEILKGKKNRVILTQKKAVDQKQQFRTILGGVLAQDQDTISDKKEDFESRTDKVPTAAELIDLEFANKLVKHTKSNTIVFAKGNQLLASGTGQTSRVDALKQAIDKAKRFNFDLKGAVMASDAFFPFPDCVEIAYLEGVTAVVQPGGSIKDKESIDYCNKNGLAMVFTGNRHFKH